MSAVVRFGGEDMLVSELGLAPVDGRGRWLRVATPAHVYLDPARGTLRRAIEIGLAVGLLLLLAALVLGYRLAAPIRLLANSVRGILQGAPSGPSASRAQRRRDEIGTLARALTKAGAELRAAEVDARATALLRRDLGRFLSPGVADVVARGEQSLSLASQRCVVTVMFVDVVGFTRIAETLGPEDGVILLNEVFSISTEAVFSQGGAVDKFVGDAVMAVFGGPYARSENHAGAALRAASITHRLIETASMGWRVRWGLEVEVAIGVHTGEAILGTVGGSARLDHTVVGEPANVAARLEALARPGRTLTSLETARAAGWPASRLSSVGSSRIPGRAIPLPLVEVGP